MGSRPRGGWRPIGVALFLRACLLPEGVALVEDAEGDLGEEGVVLRGGGPTDFAFSEGLEHADGIDAQSGVEEALDQAGDGLVPRGVPQLAVLAGRADEPLLFPVAQDSWGDADMLGQSRDGHQLVT